MSLLLLLALSCHAAATPPNYWPRFAGNRDVKLLDGVWSYGLHLDGLDSMSPEFSPDRSKTPNVTTVPSCMDVVAGGASGYLGPRGVAIYRTTFESPPEGLHVRLQFQSCSFYCRVWVNGKEVGDHRAGGYVAFWLDVPRHMLEDGGANELFVLADNRFNHTTAPMHTGGDFWHYGGLTRSVELHTMGEKAIIWRAYVLPSGTDFSSSRPVTEPAHVDVTLVLSEKENGPIEFSLAFDQGEAKNHTGIAEDGQLSLKDVAVPNAKLWSTSEPNLHTLAVGFRGGAVIERFGLRSFGVEKASSRLTINGKVKKIVGWNHHTQWPVTAASPTDEQLDDDIRLLKKGGATYVRGAHYPHDPRMLDRLDEAGIVFWSETLGPGVSTKNIQDPKWMKVQLQQMEEMLDNALNHASIITWGFFNEGPSSDINACSGYKSCSDYARGRDPTRFTTWADNGGKSSKCLQHATLISFNSYPGWYNQLGDLSAPKRTWDSDVAAVIEGSTSSGNGTVGKPFVISETGAGGIFEWDSNSTDKQWTLKYQSEVVGRDVDVAIQNDKISGITLWHFYDFKVDNGGQQEMNTHCVYDHPPPETFDDLKKYGPPNCTSIVVNHRPGGENHKGSLDFWRREKPAFRIVAEMYKKVQEPNEGSLIVV